MIYLFPPSQIPMNKELRGWGRQIAAKCLCISRSFNPGHIPASQSWLQGTRAAFGAKHSNTKLALALPLDVELANRQGRFDLGQGIRQIAGAGLHCGRLMPFRRLSGPGAAFPINPYESVKRRLWM